MLNTESPARAATADTLRSPAPGHVYLATTGQRAAYARYPSLVLTALPRDDSGALFALIDSWASSTNTANTSALVGAVNRLLAMARAVRNRSYVLIAASRSAWGARELCMACSRISNASVKSLTDIETVSAVEIDHCEPTGAPGAAFLFAHQGTGKTTIAQQLAAHLGCMSVVDNWAPGQPVTPGALHLTNATLGQGGAA